MNAIVASPGEQLEGTTQSDPSRLDKATYAAIKEQLTFRPDWRIVTSILTINLSLAALGIWLLSLGTTPAYWLAQLVFPIVFFQAFSILHDCGHGSCTTKTWLNTLIGHLVSPLCFMPYFPWKIQHALHHTWTGHLEKDPTLKLLRDWRATQRVPLLVRIAWRTWIPLAAVMNHLVFWSAPIAIWRTGTAAQVRRCVASLAWMAAFYASVHHAWPEIFAIGNFGPAIVIYLFAVELVNLPHHADQRTSTEKLALWEQAYSTRSCYYPKLVSELLVLNFNFHIEHHLFPTLPWYRLRRARDLIKPALGSGYTEAVGVRWNLMNRSKDIAKVLRARESAPTLVEPVAREQLADRPES
jgi:fatty acid desaturase